MIMRTIEEPEKLKTRSIVIVDSRGQHAVSENEFVNFMDRLESIFTSHRDHNDWDDAAIKKRNDNKSKYIDPAADELKSWIRNTDNYPWSVSLVSKDPMVEELEELNSESNPILFDNSNRNESKSFDGSHINKDSQSTLDDIAAHVRQIKEINLQYPEGERRTVKLTETHKLLTKLLKKYYDSVDPTLFEKSIDSLVHDIRSAPAATPKLGRHKDKNAIASSAKALTNGRLNVIVDTSGFRDDDRVASSRIRSGAASNEETNSAIESMLVKKSSGHAKLTGGRKHIML